MSYTGIKCSYLAGNCTPTPEASAASLRRPFSTPAGSTLCGLFVLRMRAPSASFRICLVMALSQDVAPRARSVN